jgi:hypothetical protein
MHRNTGAILTSKTYVLKKNRGLAAAKDRGLPIAEAGVETYNGLSSL